MIRDNNSFTQDNEIDFAEIVKLIWKEKILILFICLIFSVGGYVYSKQLPKIYKTEIKLRYAHPSYFEPFRQYMIIENFQTNQNIQTIEKPFNDEFNLNFLSLDTIVKFYKQYDEIKEFKSYIKNNNIDIREYFNDTIEKVTDKKKRSQNIYSFTFSKPLPAQKFLTDYVIFTKEITEKVFEKHIQLILNNSLDNLKDNLEIAKEIELENPFLKSAVDTKRNERNGDMAIVNEPDSIFYLGKIVLSLKIKHLEQAISKTQDLRFDYNPILEGASSPYIISKSAKFYIAIAFVIGFFISIVIIFLKIIFKNNK